MRRLGLVPGVDETSTERPVACSDGRSDPSRRLVPHGRPQRHTGRCVMGRGPGTGRPAGRGGAGGHRGLPADLLKQQAPWPPSSPGRTSSSAAATGGPAARRVWHESTVARREHGPANERRQPNELWHGDIMGPSSSSVPGVTTLRSGWWALSTTTRASLVRPACCRGRSRCPSSPGSTTLSSCLACPSS